MKEKWAIGLSIIAILLGVLVGCQQEARPQVAGGYGESHLYVDGSNRLRVHVQGGTSLVAFDDAVASDGNTNVAAWAFIDETNYRAVLIKNEIFNGTTWDRERGNVEVAVLASAARTVTTSSVNLTNYNGSRLLVIVNVTSVTATPNVTPQLLVQDPVSTAYFTAWTAGAPITAVGTTAYYFGDGASGGSFTDIEAFGLPARTWRIRMVHADTDSITYSVGAIVSIH